MEKDTQINTFSYTAFWKSAWGVFSKNWKQLMPITIILGLIFLILSKIQDFAGTGGVEGALAWFSTFIIQIFISIGYINIILKSIRGEDFSWKSMYERSDRFFYYVGATIIVAIFFCISLTPAIILFALSSTVIKYGIIFSIISSVLGFVCVVISLVFVLSRLYFFQFYTVDTDMKVWDIVKTTWKSTKGGQLRIFTLIIMIAMLNILGMIFFGIGLLVTVPITVLILGFTYLNVSGKIAHNDTVLPQIQPNEIV